VAAGVAAEAREEVPASDTRMNAKPAPVIRTDIPSALMNRSTDSSRRIIY
jgi:hypothetical protein